MLAHEPRPSSSLGMHLDKDGRGLPASYRLQAQTSPPFSSQHQTFAMGPAAFFGTLRNCGLAVTDPSPRRDKAFSRQFQFWRAPAEPKKQVLHAMHAEDFSAHDLK